MLYSRESRYRTAGKWAALTAATVATGTTLIISAFATPPAGQAKKPMATVPGSSGLSILAGGGVIDGSYGFQTLSVVAKGAEGSELDVTRSAAFTSTNSAVVKVENGVAIPTGDGQAEVVATYNGQTARTKLTVKNTKTDSDINFPTDITPILIKTGCNGAACHGAPNGQGGLKLSFFGYEPDKDREAFWSGDNGRRVNAKDPGTSLSLLKPCGIIPHAGGVRFAKNGPEFRILQAWIKAGGPLYGKSSASAATVSTGGVKLASVNTPAPNAPAPAAPILQSISLQPEDRTIKVQGSTHQIIVTAHYSDGSTKDVTPLARYFSDDDGIAGAKSTGLITSTRDGEANVMVRYNGRAAVSRFYVLSKPKPVNYPKTPENNFVDTHVFAKLKKMGIVPAPLCDDAQFLRRVSLDIAGVLPTAKAVRDFVADTTPDKRAKKIDELLTRPEYQDVMTIEWSE